jgi:formamidopyrimidine-DNA glycosylase
MRPAPQRGPVRRRIDRARSTAGLAIGCLRHHAARVPELPEVEHARRVVERVGVGMRIVAARCADDPIVLADGSTRTEEALTGRRVGAARRRGKWLWLELDRGPHPLFHLGMTGSFRARGEAPLVLQTGPHAIGDEWPPRFAKVTLELEGERGADELVFTNTRRLGRVLLREEPEREPPIAELGFDPLLDLPSEVTFRALLASRRGTLKGLLLDQSFAAGVGNWVADEVLYQARLDPRRTIDALTPAEVRRLRSTLRDVVCLAVDVDADASRYPPGWLFHHRWEDGRRTHRGEPIERITVAGRTTAWVPSRQK